MAAVMTTAASLLFVFGVHNDGRVELSLAVPWWLLAIAFGLAESCSLQLRFRQETHTVTLSEIVLVVGCFATSANGVVAAQLVAAFVILTIVWRQPLLKLAVNVSQYALAVVAALCVFRALADPHNPLAVRSWLAALAACATSACISLLVVHIAIRLTDGRLSRRALVQAVGLGLAGSVVNAMLGLVVVIECAKSVAAAALLVAPVLVVFVAYRAYLSERVKSQGLEFLYSASEVLNRAQDLDIGLLALLDFARDTFHADIAEIRLREEADDVRGYRLVSGPGAMEARTESLAPSAVGRVVALAQSVRGALAPTGPESPLQVIDGVVIESAVVALLKDESGVRGTLVLGRAQGTIERFRRDEIRLFETFANHLGATLEARHLTASLDRLRKAEQELAHQAYHDSLTGLANRVLFHDRVDAAIDDVGSDGGTVAVLFVDLDDFKTVNDSLGHAAGDMLLVEVAQRLVRCVGSRDTVGRLGGDEFALVLRSIAHPSQVHLVANSILNALAEPCDIGGVDVVAPASIGIAFLGPGVEAAELMQQADVAMYAAKRDGKHRFQQFEPNMSLTVAQRLQLKVGLQRAVGAREFDVEYQPVADVATGRIVAAEALLRWRHPANGTITPSEFVDVAEETGLIVPIGRQVLRDACRRAAEWSAIAPTLGISVNLSGRQLAHPDIVRDVTSALRVARLAPERLTIEVTETALMRDVEEAKTTLCALRQLGITIAIDDFGTGFSSLSHLRQLPIDTVKIAKPIVDLVCNSDGDAAFVRGIIELSHVVGMTVIAEGVERAEQHTRLAELGCDQLQGFAFGAPMTADALRERLLTEPLLSSTTR
jgi:diguanylate cyclase (GGDEF)-like protein